MRRLGKMREAGRRWQWFEGARGRRRRREAVVEDGEKGRGGREATG